MSPVFGVLGLGEAGSEIASGLVRAGAVVRGFDPLFNGALPGVTACGSDAEAASGAQIVLALTSAREAVQTLSLALPGLGPGALYADLDTGPAGLKVRLASLAAQAGVRFADVAAAVIEALRAG
jgi:3-hydroxyisobutyrate dehydrogenase-like beta-hydroxyacid dehydrogenase